MFASDRGNNLNSQHLISNYYIHDKNFYRYDIYIINRDGSNVQRITDLSSNEQTPVFSPKGDRIAYTSDRSGINNIYIYNLESGVEYPITNVITGIFHLSWQGDADKLAFASFYYAGYDIYLLKNPLNVLKNYF